MAGHGKAKKRNKPMLIACILFYLTMLSVCMTSGLYAKYSATDSSEDSARVAKFSVTETATQFSKDLVVEITPGTVFQEIVIENASEVAIDYTITLTNTTENMPVEFQMHIKDAADTFKDNNADANAYEATCSLEPNAKETVVINLIFEQENAQEYIGMVDLVTIDIVAEQMD